LNFRSESSMGPPPLSTTERSKRWREKLKSNPEAYVEHLKKERDRRNKRKNDGRTKVIEDLSERGKRQQRKIWRLRQNNCRERNRKSTETESETIDGDLSVAAGVSHDHVPGVGVGQTTPNICQEITPTAPESAVQLRIKLRGRKKVRKDRCKAYRRIEALERKLELQNRLMEKYKKAYNRLAKQNVNRGTPRSKTKRDLKGSQVTPHVRRTLIFHNSLMSEMRGQFDNAQSLRQKRTLSQVITGKLLRKYRVFNMIQQFGGSIKIVRTVNENRVKSRKWNVVTPAVIMQVRDFYVREDNSRSTAGKKETITRAKVKKQIHMLNDSAKHLHAKFLSENTNSKIAFSTFARLRLFWVVNRPVSQRNTCLCRTCDNMQFLANKLRSESLTTTTDLNKLSGMFCCSTGNAACMLGECTDCSTATQYPTNIDMFDTMADVDMTKTVTWYQWKSLSEIRTKLGPTKTKEFQVKVVKKVEITGTVGDLCDTFEDAMRSRGQRHVYTIGHQYRAVTAMKTRMAANETTIHIDFAEK
jgi:hypothetical protein